MNHESLLQYRVFRGLSLTDIKAVDTNLTRMSFDTGSVILHEGKSIQALWLILEGKCDVRRRADDGSEMQLAELGPGDVFGEMSFVRAAPHSATISARSDVRVCTYTREDFLKLAESRPAAALQILSSIASVLAERLHHMDTWICEFVDRPEGVPHRDEWQSFRSTVYTNWNF